ncbi:hypothetical protein BBK36DRAFT_1157789 [Trichoderma citrinoviride]|uniref:Uncharacterized protein n=1 Tax=Trichoderma citrinoviride TaxID=58853 RepID=A0A2T4BFK0_9HYPO|nr:hypothetical protein BBK36DRAFT_1157789 [Trichoderma citrinoviride]PTB68110.1 hypothetical protein BBK36DRAFT_1157789 [Trichoderma citrinoviride]
MAMDAESLASWIVLLFSIFRWLLHIFFATGYIILCKWLQHIRNHEFDQQHRKIDRRYCQMATVFYGIAAAAHLIALLKMMYRAMAGYSSDRQEKNWWEFLGSGIKMQVASLCLTAVVLTGSQSRYQSSYLQGRNVTVGVELDVKTGIMRYARMKP